jgi:hypothetical protein
MNAAIRARLLASVALLVLSSSVANAQSLTDAIRVSQEELPLAGRPLSMGGTGIAGANNYGALGLNPAALAPITSRELMLSLLNFDHESSSQFLGTFGDGSLTSTSLSAVGGVFPADTRRGHFAFGLGYDLVRDYTRAYAFKAVNPNSSFLNTQDFVQDPRQNLRGQQYRDYLDEQANLAWKLYLTRDVSDSVYADPLRTIPFTGGLEQSGDVTEEGGLHALRIGAAIDIAEGVSVGATVNGYFGNYNYYRKYTERDVNGVFAGNADSLPPLNFSQAQITDSRHQDQGGIGLKLGLLAWQLDMLRFGLTLETPTLLHVEDDFVRTGTSVFTNGSTHSLTAENAISTVNSYNITTPLRFSGGLAFKMAGATLEANASYADMSQIRYSNADIDLSDLNDAARQTLRGVFSWRVGAEYIFAPLGMSVRAGYGFEPSAYKADPSNYGKSSITAGIGALLSKSVMLEASFMQTKYTTDHTVYADYTVDDPKKFVSAYVTNDAVKQTTIALTLSFRY